MKRLTELLINENNIKEAVFGELETVIEEAYNNALSITKNDPELVMQAFSIFLNSKNNKAFEAAISKLKK